MLEAAFRITGVPGRIKMYGALAMSDVHTVVLVAGKNNVYASVERNLF